MFELERHIEILLLSNDCVIIPGFGGFMAHYVGACYEESECIFLPPQRTIGFNPQLTLNDSLLVQSYIEAYDISYPEALRRIEDEVREMRQHIETEGYFELFELGTISLNDCGRYVFEPCESGILTPELYGLNSFIIKPIDSLDTSSYLEMPESNDANDTSDEEHVVHFNALRNIAVACIALFAFFLLSSPIGNSEMNISEARINTKMLNKILPQCEHLGASAMKISNKSDYTEKNQPLVNIKLSQNKSCRPFYTVVLCSRITVKNAHLYVKHLHKQGLSNAIVSTCGRYTKVISGNYPTETEATTAATVIQRNFGISDCWVTKLTE